MPTDQTLRPVVRQSQIESLLADLSRWAQASATSSVVREQQRLLGSLLVAAPELVARIQSPLLIATFGGTGVGKSTLVNALVGAEITRAGVTRPTTCVPTLVIHQETSLSSLGFSTPRSSAALRETSSPEFHVQQLDLPILKQFALLDFPDVDVDEIAIEGSNLARVRELLPLCDVLLVVSTQEKYRQARLQTELRAAASHARVLFVQTFADRDEDIREDWRKDLVRDFERVEIFFVDSKKGLEESRRGMRPAGEFGQLMATLEQESIDGLRPLLRHNNLIDLIENTLSQARSALEAHRPLVQRVSDRLEAEDRKLTANLSERLKTELESEQQPWEERLISAVAEAWTISPLSALLRFRARWSTFLGSYALLRSRTVVQATIAGSLQAVDWLQRSQRDSQARAALDQLGTSALTEADLRNLASIVQGDASQAGFDPIDWSTDQRRQEAGQLQLTMCLKARELVDQLVQKLVKSNASPVVRWGYEILLCLFPAWLLWRICYNFFYEAFWLGKPHLETSFYFPAALLLAGWCALWVWLITRRLKRGLQHEIRALASDLARQQIPGGLFIQLRERVDQFEQFEREVQNLHERARVIQKDLRNRPTHLGFSRHQRLLETSKTP
ncbi:hypothetical protein Plim_3738 [Planctopirus limnophila DSM 3776]|uniref:Uncharacterized protein n=1 Tax=Planctopirus limnophila (strain ATCC 43296 / DSM 3776 / IFAM 1008 / Mu 290) TaxID=521674 RepID=D5SWF7_PLAL2|nr:GTPase [Planctopirus limnophila]ADG69550.1 hypothetical protein Plim_3738 [Planctopirus limnophila DSM 3776]